MSVIVSTSSEPTPFDGLDRHSLIPIHFCSGNSYVVASMQLMSTTFRRVDGSVSRNRTFRPDPVQLNTIRRAQYTYIGNDILRAKLIQNIRRSGPISESFT